MSGVEVTGPGLTRGRYYATAAHADDVYDSWGRHYIARDLLRQRASEGRSDTARHHFVHEDKPPKHEGLGWYTRAVVCTTCDERRQIGIPVEDLNFQERWCIAPKAVTAITRWLRPRKRRRVRRIISAEAPRWTALVGVMTPSERNAAIAEIARKMSEETP